MLLIIIKGGVDLANIGKRCRGAFGLFALPSLIFSKLILSILVPILAFFKLLSLMTI